MTRRFIKEAKLSYDCTLWNNAAGTGSTATRIKYFNNNPIRKDNGAFTQANDSTDGCRITIKKAGLYAVAGWDAGFDSITSAGISKNASNVSAVYNSQADAEKILAISKGSAGGPCGFSFGIFYLKEGDVLRLHEEDDSDGAGIEAGMFVCKVEVF